MNNEKMTSTPSEKVFSSTIQKRSSVELVSTLIGKVKNECSVELAKRILEDNSNNLVELGKRSLQSLQDRYGLSKSKATTLYTALEMCRRYEEHSDYNPRAINSIKDAYHLMAKQLNNLQHEEFWVVYLNTANKVITKKCIGVGGIDGVVVDVRLIIADAVEFKATNIILYHNHPNALPEPSVADMETTKRIVRCAELFDIVVNDHIIFAGKNFYSFRQDGKLEDFMEY
jgi:DNA repair protein RadC